MLGKNKFILQWLTTLSMMPEFSLTHKNVVQVHGDHLLFLLTGYSVATPQAFWD